MDQERSARAAIRRSAKAWTPPGCSRSARPAPPSRSPSPSRDLILGREVGALRPCRGRPAPRTIGTMHGVDRITTVEMHTGGEPVRIVTGGYPPLEGRTLLEKRRFARDRLDHLRRMLMAEPRGHADMYGALLVEPDLDGPTSRSCSCTTRATRPCAATRWWRWAATPSTAGWCRARARDGGADTVPVRAGDRDGPGRDGRPAAPGSRACRPSRTPGRCVVTQERPGHPGRRLRRRLLRHPAGGDAQARPGARPARAPRRRRHARQGRSGGPALPRAPTEPELAFLYGIMLTDGADEYSPRSTLNICVFADGGSTGARPGRA